MKLIEVDLTLCDRYDHELCRICNNVDELTCDRGMQCSGLRIGDRPAPIGYFLDEDDSGRSAYTFRFADTDEFLFCEDCAIDIEETSSGVTDPILEGTVDDLAWYIDIADDGFQAWIATYGPDHGVTMEQERGVFDTLTEAVAASRDYALALIKTRDDAEARDEFETENLDVVATLRGFGRLKHPTDLAVPTTLTVDELNVVLQPSGYGEPSVTVREHLIDACREMIGEMIADLIEDGKIPTEGSRS